LLDKMEDSITIRQTSPRSNLTSALQNDTDSRTRADSITMSGLTPQFPGGMPINSHPRRESLAGSMMGGISWGGVSMSSWIRDEYEHFFSSGQNWAKN
jgi:hypothetical protein